jgi:hypothetical protein
MFNGSASLSLKKKLENFKDSLVRWLLITSPLLLISAVAIISRSWLWTGIVTFIIASFILLVLIILAATVFGLVSALTPKEPVLSEGARAIVPEGHPAEEWEKSNQIATGLGQSVSRFYFKHVPEFPFTFVGEFYYRHFNDPAHKFTIQLHPHDAGIAYHNGLKRFEASEDEVIEKDSSGASQRWKIDRSTGRVCMRTGSSCSSTELWIQPDGLVHMYFFSW